jgi:hypothetical protein
MLIAIVVSGFALLTASAQLAQPAHLAPAACCMGMGICSMHYTGMAAMEVEPGIELRRAALRRVGRRRHRRRDGGAVAPFTLRSTASGACTRGCERGHHGPRHRRHALHRHGRAPISRRTRSAFGGPLANNRGWRRHSR